MSFLLIGGVIASLLYLLAVIRRQKALAEIKKKGIDQYKAQLEGEVNKRLDTEKDKVGDKLKGVLGY